ncbi:MAG: hypothetical protein ABII72_03985 [Parcubacteria group bacterium]
MDRQTAESVRATDQLPASSERRKKKKPLWRKMIALAVAGGMGREEVKRRMTRHGNGNIFFSPPIKVTRPDTGAVVTVISVDVNSDPKKVQIMQGRTRMKVVASAFFPSTKA